MLIAVILLLVLIACMNIIYAGSWTICTTTLSGTEIWYIIPTISFTKHKYERSINILWLNTSIKFYWISEL
jgi:hypothetical protein